MIRKLATVALVTLLLSFTTAAVSDQVGVSYDEVMSDLSGFFRMTKSTPVDGRDRYMGLTADKLGVLEIIGNKANVFKTTLLIGIPNDNPEVLARNTAILLRFLKNTVPEFPSSKINVTLTELVNNPDQWLDQVHGDRRLRMILYRKMGSIVTTVQHK